jgi:hypothetical protein
MTFRREVWLPGLAALVLVAHGCASPYVYYCDDTCGPQSISGRYPDCAATPCDPCEGTVGEPFCGLTVTGKLREMVTCGAGCGQLYWGEWTFDPPDECDPCNDYGDWVGPQCCPPHGWAKFWSGVHGHRYGDPCCPEGCDDCADPGEAYWEGGTIGSAEMLDSSESVVIPDPEMGSAVEELEGPSHYYSRHPHSRLIRSAR